MPSLPWSRCHDDFFGSTPLYAGTLRGGASARVRLENVWNAKDADIDFAGAVVFVPSLSASPFKNIDYYRSLRV